MLVGRAALWQRLGFSPLLQDEMQEGRFPPNFVEWTGIAREEETGRLVVADGLTQTQRALISELRASRRRAPSR